MSDEDFSDFNSPLPNSLDTLYLQNFEGFNPRIKTLPLGVENLRIAMNGRKHLFRDIHINVKKSKRMLVGPYGNTHPERISIVRHFEADSGPWDVQRYFLSAEKYAVLSSKYLFVACPRGNGLDTHRFWETLYRGSYPVVLDTEWSRSMIQLGIPVIVVPDWSPRSFEKVYDSDLSTISNFDPLEIEAIWMPYWQERFASLT
jgi:hypothetical protein